MTEEDIERLAEGEDGEFPVSAATVYHGPPEPVQILLDPRTAALFRSHYPEPDIAMRDVLEAFVAERIRKSA